MKRSLNIISYRLCPVEDEAVGGEMRVQITYEQYKVAYSPPHVFVISFILSPDQTPPNTPRL